MKVQYDTGWDSLINGALSKRSVDKLEGTNSELSKSSSISTATNVWTAKRLWQRKDHQKVPKRHRFPPSLLTVKAADLWNTLMPLRANCSCSSVSVSDKCSRLSFGVSISDATVDSNSDSSVPPIKEAVVRETLVDTLEYTHLAFGLLVAPMVRLFNNLNEKPGSLMSHVGSGLNLEIIPPPNPNSEKNTEMIVGDNNNRFPSIKSVSSNSSDHYRDYWSAGRTGKKWESSSKFEIAEQKRRGKSFFSPSLLVPKTLRVSKSVLTKEELVYLLQYKKTLLFEYFQRKVDSTDLRKKLDSTERETLIHGTQSDSRLQEHNLHEFVQFIRERKKNDTTEDVLKKDVHLLETQNSNTNSTSLNNEDSHNLSIPKRRVTFSDPLAEDSPILLSCSSSDNEDGILPVQSFTTAMTNNVEIPRVEETRSDASFDSKSTSPSDSSVSLKACFANLSLKSSSKKPHDPNLNLHKSTIEQTVQQKNFTDERLGSTQSESNDQIEWLENSSCHDTSTDVNITEKEFKEKANEVLKPSLPKLSQSGITETVEQQFSDSDVCDRPSVPSGKSVTFQDCCQTISEQSIISDEKEPQPMLQSDDKWASSSESKGRFELSWKGCWDRQSTSEFVQSTRQLEANSSEDEEQLVESNPAGITSESVVSTPINAYRVEPHLCLDNQTSPSLCSHSSNSPSFTAVAASLEKDEMIPWTIEFTEDFSTHGFEADPEAIKLRNRSELRRGLGNVYEGIMNPEIWRSEVRAKATSLCKPDWYTERDSHRCSWNSSGIRSDWLIRKLEELKSSPETDYESDYYAESEIESDFECEKDSPLVKRTFSNLDTHYKNCRRFTAKRKSFGPGLFLNKVLSGKNIIFNECRCNENTRSKRNDLRPREHGLRHTSFEETEQRSNQNFFSHLRARLILDSETDDSDFAASIQPSYRYDLNRKDEHVNKMKRRRFIRSLRSIRSDDDRQFSSTRLLHKAIQKAFNPESVQGALSTRTIGTNPSEEQNIHNMMDVCIDTYDLYPRKQIGTTNKASDSIFLNKTSSCQTVDSLFGTSNSVQCTKGVTQASLILPAETATCLESNLQAPRSNEQRISSALENLSNHINNASNNLAKLRFSEIKTEPKRVEHFPVTKGDNFTTTPPIPSTPPILSRFSPPVNMLASVRTPTKKSSNDLNNSNSSILGESGCPICNVHKKPAGRYVLPACVVKGAGPDSKLNKKDPWNHVMERAKAQSHWYKRRNTLTCLDTRTSLKRSRVSSSAYDCVHLKSFGREQDSIKNDQSREEEVRIQPVQVKNNSSQQPAIYDSEHPAVKDKISSPPCRKDKPLRLPTTSALYFPTSSDSPMSNLPRTRSPRRTKKPQDTKNASNRLLYIISESTELTHLQIPIKSPVANLFT